MASSRQIDRPSPLPPKRREEVDQRLWWGYTKLGMRRVESGEYEDALDPLIHALRYGEIGPDRQAETRSALARALEGVADVRALAIRLGIEDRVWFEGQVGQDDLPAFYASLDVLAVPSLTTAGTGVAVSAQWGDR